MSSYDSIIDSLNDQLVVEKMFNMVESLKFNDSDLNCIELIPSSAFVNF